jgi:hypothetical protein
MPLSTLQATPRDETCKTQGQDGVALSFPAGLFHPLQHTGLARRSPTLLHALGAVSLSGTGITGGAHGSLAD